MDEKCFRNVHDAVGNLVDRKLQRPPQFGGEPGEVVPAVEPDDLKVVWHEALDV
jgi:hypothetical protein